MNKRKSSDVFQRLLIIPLIAVLATFWACTSKNTLTRVTRSTASDQIDDPMSERYFGVQRYWNASGVEDGLLFTIRSVNAQAAQLVLFSEAVGQDPVFGRMLKKEGDTFTVHVSHEELINVNLTKTIYYGYRFWGPNWKYDSQWKPGTSFGFLSDVDEIGNRFNPNKVLFDPYAFELSHDPLNNNHNSAIEFATGPDYRHIDSAKVATKGIYLPEFHKSQGPKNKRHFKDEIIYEAHVRGLTMLNTDLPMPKNLRGTYLGATYMIPYLKNLGITAIEFLPVQETQNDQNDFDPKSSRDDQYWGYMTLNYFAPERRYSSDKSPGGPTREFQAMTKAFNEAGIKVYIDVVYNHTGEKGLWKNDPDIAELYSFRGIDNASYYLLPGENRRYNFDGPTGVGNTYNSANELAADLIIDSLRHWRDMGVEGFRFDLAPILGNTNRAGQPSFAKMEPLSVLNRIVREIPGRERDSDRGVDLIAEPWAIGIYKVGEFPLGWAEWNGKFRDLFRKKMNKLGFETIYPSDLTQFIAGSDKLFADDGRKPYHSVNFMVAHDGFTMRDLFSYNESENHKPWPYGPSEGGEDKNISWDQGKVLADQLKAAKNALAILLLSAGTPMFTAGDENFRTQYGNNNAYNLDSEMNWLRWEDYKSKDSRDVFSFTKKMIELRKKIGALRRFEYFNGRDNNGNGLPDITWLNQNGPMQNSDYGNSEQHLIGYHLDLTEEKNPKWKSMTVYFNFGAGESRERDLRRMPRDLEVTIPSQVQVGKYSAYASSAASLPLVDANRRFKIQPRSFVVFTENL